MPNTDPITIPIRGKDELTPAIKSASGGIGGFVNSVKGMTAGLQDVTAGIGFLKIGLQAIGDAYKMTVGRATEYADTVRQLSRVTGESAEDTSRLIQLTDDLGVEMSDLEAASRAAAAKGIAFNTESLARLADEYVALSDPVARNTLLIDNFGKSATKVSAAFEGGGAKIRQMSEAVSENLILTQKQLDQSRALELQIDDLNDTIDGYKIQIGTAVIPALVDYIDTQERLNDTTDGFTKMLLNFAPIRIAATALTMGQTTALRQEKEATDALTKSTDTLTASAQRHTDAQRVAMQGNTSKTSGWNDPNWKPVQSFVPTQQTLTVKNDATLNVKITATGLDAGLNWSNIIQKTIRDMQSAGIIPKATR